MAYLIVIFGVWFLWNIILVLFSTPQWFPYLLSIALGIGGACLIETSTWWYGIGLAGAAAFLLSISDLLLVTTDSLRAEVLRHRAPRR